MSLPVSRLNAVWVDSALLMQTDWYWRRFLNDVMAGELAKPINTIEKRSNAKQKLIIELYNFNRLHRRLLETKIPDDILVFELEHGPNALATENAGTQQLQTLNDIDRCYDLVINIEMNPDFAWYWMRFTFGVPLSAVYFDKGNGNIANLWDDILSPWMPLVG